MTTIVTGKERYRQRNGRTSIRYSMLVLTPRVAQQVERLQRDPTTGEPIRDGQGLPLTETVVEVLTPSDNLNAAEQATLAPQQISAMNDGTLTWEHVTFIQHPAKVTAEEPDPTPDDPARTRLVVQSYEQDAIDLADPQVRADEIEAALLTGRTL